MSFDGARVYTEGVGIGQDCEEKICQIIHAIKTISPSSDVSMRFVKSGNLYEGLLWGKADCVPLGVYHRGQSMAQLLDTLHKKVKKECLKAAKTKAIMKFKDKTKFQRHSPMAMAG